MLGIGIGLARLTLRATAPGESTIGVAFRDLNDDGAPDLGPFFRNVSGQPIGDTNGDTFFDGPTSDARVSVGAPCPNSGGVPADEGSSGTSALVWVIGGATAGVVVAGLAGLTLRRLARRHARA